MKILWGILFFLISLGGDNSFARGNKTHHVALCLKGSPKYKKNFSAFDYALPDKAPCGRLCIGDLTSFTSFNPFGVKTSPPLRD